MLADSSTTNNNFFECIFNSPAGVRASPEYCRDLLPGGEDSPRTTVVVTGGNQETAVLLPSALALKNVRNPRASAIFHEAANPYG
jgi:hypothetical protein